MCTAVATTSGPPDPKAPPHASPLARHGFPPATFLPRPWCPLHPFPSSNSPPAPTGSSEIRRESAFWRSGVTCSAQSCNGPTLRWWSWSLFAGATPPITAAGYRGAKPWPRVQPASATSQVQSSGVCSQPSPRTRWPQFAQAPLVDPRAISGPRSPGTLRRQSAIAFAVLKNSFLCLVHGRFFLNCHLVTLVFQVPIAVGIWGHVCARLDRKSIQAPPPP